jgi:hypothetical protein
MPCDATAFVSWTPNHGASFQQKVERDYNTEMDKQHRPHSLRLTGAADSRYLYGGILSVSHSTGNGEKLPRILIEKAQGMNRCTPL